MWSFVWLNLTCSDLQNSRIDLLSPLTVYSIHTLICQVFFFFWVIAVCVKDVQSSSFSISRSVEN